MKTFIGYDDGSWSAEFHGQRQYSPLPEHAQRAYTILMASNPEPGAISEKPIYAIAGFGVLDFDWGTPGLVYRLTLYGA